MIRGYPDVPCVTQGDTLRLHVSTDAHTFSVRFLRWGDVAAELPASGPFNGHDCAPRRAGEPWDWREYAIAVDERWTPGVYAALLQTRSDEPRTFDARSGRALFVVREPEHRANLLVVLPLFTYQAYNVAHVDGTLRIDEGESLYSGSKWVTLHRPGGGTGGHPWDEVNADAYDGASPRQTFAHWDGKALAWLEQNSIAYDCCTDAELHTGAMDLQRYRAVASFGHHEYWTDAMRARIESFVADGGNVAFFGGNTCWFRLEYDESRKAIRRVGRWDENPEWRLTGVSYAYGGGKWIGERPATGYHVERSDHWIFAETGLRKGDVFGAHERLVGYECDGAPAENDASVLASASIAHWPVADGSGELSQTARADMTLREAGGMVFSASTADWARVLAGGDAAVAQITRNVLQRFAGDRCT